MCFCVLFVSFKTQRVRVTGWGSSQYQLSGIYCLPTTNYQQDKLIKIPTSKSSTQPHYLYRSPSQSFYHYPQMLAQHHSKYDVQLLYKLFKDRDSQSKGWLAKHQFEPLLSRGLRNSFHLDSEVYVFEDLLRILSDSEENGAPSSYIHEFLGLLQQQQQKYEEEKVYEQAELIEKRCIKIRTEEYLRRARLLKETYSQRTKVFNNIVLQRLEEFQLRWDQHIKSFERQSREVLYEINIKHAKQRSQSSYTKMQSAIPDPKSSKQLQALKTKEKILVKTKQYQQAGRVRDFLSMFKTKIASQALQNQEESTNQRLQNIKKQQSVIVQSLKDKISLERSKQMARRKQLEKSILLRAKLVTRDFNTKLAQEEGIMTASLKEEFKITPDNQKKHISPFKKRRGRFVQII